MGLPADVVAQLRQAPFWPALEAMAHTLVYETKILGDGSLPTELAASIAAPTLVIAGGESFPYMRETASAFAKVIPDARARVLEGQTHDVVPLAQPLCWRSSSRRVGRTETKVPSRRVRSRYSSEMLWLWLQSPFDHVEQAPPSVLRLRAIQAA